MEANGKNRFGSQGVSIAQMMFARKYKLHKIALFNSMKKSNLAPISVFLSLNIPLSHQKLSWAVEGPKPLKETQAFKEEFFGKQLRDHYPRALISLLGLFDLG